MNPRWYEEIFDEDYLAGYSGHLTPERSAGEAEAIREILDLRPGLRVLDLPCGQGRHGRVLQAQGIRIAGLDLSSYLLGAARTAGVKSLARGDMRRLPFRDASFDAAYNVYSSFGYFDEEEDDLRVLREVARVLRPGGRFLLDNIDRDALIQPGLPFPHRYWSRGKGQHLLDEVGFDPVRSRFSNHRLIIRDDGTRREVEYSVRAYTAREITAMLAEAGLETRRLLQGLKPGVEYEAGRSRRLGVLAVRP
jgi:SAM-dependent methyltransferase